MSYVFTFFYIDSLFRGLPKIFFCKQVMDDLHMEGGWRLHFEDIKESLVKIFKENE
jgi:hypothetical protein